MPVATKAFVKVLGIVAVNGVTAIELNVAGVTVIVAVAVLVPLVAVMTEEPTATPVETPVGKTATTELVPELQITVSLISAVVPSEKVPVAINACKLPIGTVAVKGASAIETNVALVTVSVAEPVFPLRVAVIEAEPAEIPVARPEDTTVASNVLLEDQVTVLLILTLVPSE